MTEIAASAQTIRAVGAALARARLFDDKIGASDEGRIAAWSEAVDPYNLSHDDLMAAVTAYYQDNPDGRTMQVADLIRHARAIRRDRAEREPDQFREARQSQIDARVAEHVADIAEARAIPYERPSNATSFNPLTVHCPWCHAGPGSRCRIPSTDLTLSEIGRASCRERV